MKELLSMIESAITFDMSSIGKDNSHVSVQFICCTTAQNILLPDNDVSNIVAEKR